MTVACVGLGSNLGDPVRQVETAMDELARLPETRLAARSSLYRSRPVGPQDQPEFINAVVVLETALTAFTLLRHMQALENNHARQRGGQRWGPRTLDLDLLLYGDEVLDTDELKVPHPEMCRRGFVLQPLLEIAPDTVIPGAGAVRDVIKGVDTSDLVRLNAP